MSLHLRMLDLLSLGMRCLVSFQKSFFSATSPCASVLYHPWLLATTTNISILATLSYLS